VLRGEARVRTQIVLRRLADLNAGEYEDWMFQDLSVALVAVGIAARKSGGADSRSLQRTEALVCGFRSILSR